MKKPKPYKRLACAICARDTREGPLTRKGAKFYCEQHKGETKQ